MSALHNISHVAQQIEEALSSETLPARFKQTGAQLLAQLQKPLQVTAIGLPRSGKTSLINMMLGQPLMPSNLNAGVIEVAYGPAVRTVFEDDKGHVTAHDAPVTEVQIPGGVFRLRLEMPAETLLLKSYAEIGLTGDTRIDDRLMAHAAQASAITIWCSETFEASEQALWAAMPDHIMDHGFLALTMADRQMKEGRLTDRIAALDDIVAEEFLGLYPVATLQAIAARGKDGGDTSDRWKRSGGEALFQAVERQASLGLSEDHDRAKLFLEQILAVDPAAQAPARAKPTQAAAKTAPAKAADAQAEGAQKGMFDEALNILKSGADKMLGDDAIIAAPTAKPVIQHCITALQDLSDLFADVSATVPSIEALMDDVEEGRDMLLLLQLEDCETSAADAVALMLQLKKEISANAYA